MAGTKVTVTFALTMGFVGALSAVGAQAFESFEVSDHDKPSLRYRFSRAEATSDDPIVITAIGRELEVADRENHVDLQKVWLRQNIPKKMKFASRFLVTECGEKHHGKWDACDAYTYSDSKGKEAT
jgi:hypothetical protein